MLTKCLECPYLLLIITVSFMYKDQISISTIIIFVTSKSFVRIFFFKNLLNILSFLEGAQ